MSLIDKSYDSGASFIYGLPHAVHPRFSGGLLLKDQYERYSKALAKRVARDCDGDLADYVAKMAEAQAAYDRHFAGATIVEPISDDLKQRILNDPYFEDNFGNKSAIIAASCMRDPAFFREVCEKHKNVPGIFNVQGKFGDRAIDHICIMLAEEELSILLEYDVDVKLISAFGGNCLHWLTEEELSILLEYDVDVKLISAFGGNCLHWLACAVDLKNETHAAIYSRMEEKISKNRSGIRLVYDLLAALPSDYLI